MNSILKLELKDTVYSQLRELIKIESRFEQVGILFGTLTESIVSIENFVGMENLDLSAFSFSIDYEILVKEILHFQERKKNLAGFFHSHPHGESTYPSKIDISFMKLWPSPYVWLIGVSPNKIDAYTIIDDLVKHLKFEIKTNY
jgi:proteasome lid subunit RPN8/RPN11